MATFPITFVKHFNGQSSIIVDSDLTEPKKVTEKFVANLTNQPRSVVRKWCRANNPTLCVFDVDANEEHWYSYKSGYIGCYPRLFKMEN